MSDNTKISKEDKMVTESTNSPSGSTKDKHSERYQSNKKNPDHYKEKRCKRRSKRRSPSSSSRSDSETSDRSRHSRDKRRDRRTKHRRHRRDSNSSSASSSPSRSRSSSGSSSSSRSRSYRRRDRKHNRSRKYESSRKYNNHKNRHGNKRRDSHERSEHRNSTRSRTRSPHPLLRHATATDTSSVKSLIGLNNSNKFWDGFQWVDKITGNQQEDPAVLNQTKKMRRFTISNVPFQLGVDERELESFVTKFIMENYLNDQKTVQHVREVTVDRSLNTATVELSSIEEASRLAKIDCINILGHSCRICRVGDSKFGAAPTLVNLLTDAQRTAQARAAVIKAMDILQKKDNGSTFEMKQPDLGAFVAPPQ